jgi:uncharacterized protein (TIGR02186 family)
MRLFLRLSVFILTTAFFIYGSPAEQDQENSRIARVSVVPDAIDIHAFYKGTDVEVRANLPVDCDGAVVKIQGDAEKISLNKKGRVSFLWLNVDDVTMLNAPDIYILNASAPLENFSDSNTRQQLLLGYEALKEHIKIQGSKALSGSEFPEFVKLKESSGAYRQATTALLASTPDSKHNSFRALLHIPPVMPSGSYQVHLYYFKNRALEGESSTLLKVEKVGIPRYLHSLAFNHPAFYGVFACVIAIVTGIIMSSIFGSRKRPK